MKRTRSTRSTPISDPSPLSSTVETLTSGMELRTPKSWSTDGGSIGKEPRKTQLKKMKLENPNAQEEDAFAAVELVEFEKIIGRLHHPEHWNGMYYLFKWKASPIKEATWEVRSTQNSEGQEAIDQYDRENKGHDVNILPPQGARYFDLRDKNGKLLVDSLHGSIAQSTTDSGRASVEVGALTSEEHIDSPGTLQFSDTASNAQLMMTAKDSGSNTKKKARRRPKRLNSKHAQNALGFYSDPASSGWNEYVPSYRTFGPYNVNSTREEPSPPLEKAPKKTVTGNFKGFLKNSQKAKKAMENFKGEVTRYPGRLIDETRVQFFTIMIQGETPVIIEKDMPGNGRFVEGMEYYRLEWEQQGENGDDTVRRVEAFVPVLEADLHVSLAVIEYWEHLKANADWVVRKPKYDAYLKRATEAAERKKAKVLEEWDGQAVLDA